LARLAKRCGRASSLRVDGGPKFAGCMLDCWACLNRVEIDFSRPGKPTDNAHTEAFNARLQVECLNAYWFLSMADARQRIDQWRVECNQHRPHPAFGGLTQKGLRREASRAQTVE